MYYGFHATTNASKIIGIYCFLTTALVSGCGSGSGSGGGNSLPSQIRTLISSSLAACSCREVIDFWFVGLQGATQAECEEEMSDELSPFEKDIDCISRATNLLLSQAPQHRDSIEQMYKCFADGLAFGPSCIQQALGSNNCFEATGCARSLQENIRSCELSPSITELDSIIDTMCPSLS